MFITTLGIIEELVIAGHTFKFREADATLVLAFLVPSMGLYGLRRYTDKRFK